MRNPQLLFRLLACFLLFFTACADKQDDPRPQTKTELLTARTWKLNKLLGNGADITNNPLAAEYKNLTIRFQADGTYTLTGPTGILNGTWAFAEAETKLLLDPNTANATTWDILELKDNSTKIKTSRFIPALGQSVELTFEFVHA